jgi:hypothetical protein
MTRKLKMSVICITTYSKHMFSIKIKDNYRKNIRQYDFTESILLRLPKGSHPPPLL